MNTLRRARVVLAIVVWSLCFTATWAFKPGIHEDMTKEVLAATSRTVDTETLTFRPKAVEEIREANKHTDLSSDFFRPFKHFDDELFSLASQRLIDLRESVISNITAEDPNGQQARQDLGTALHTLQDFYAHSNWVEIGHSGILSSLGRSALVDPLLSTAFCPGDPEVLSGDGLSVATTGYYVGLLGCGPLPFNKCYHGGPGGCDGINKDSPDRGPKHLTARSLATQATQDYLNQILDDPRVAGNAKAIKALMRINGTLGMVIDDTGSMGSVIGQVKAQVALIVAAVIATGQEPDEYLLVRFGDPDVGPPYKTTSALAFLAHVNSLSANGGGDCPELSQSGLLQAIAASRKDSQLFMFTDASSKDAGLSGAVSAAAHEKRIKISEAAGSCSPIDPTYVKNTEETGGQLFFLSGTTAGSLFDLIRPQLTGDFVTLARISSELASSTRELTVPVDSTITTVVFSVALDFPDSVVVHRPSGATVQATDPGVTIRDLPAGKIVSITGPEAGRWTLSATGSGALTMSVQANSPLDLFSFEFVELFNPVHPGYVPISGQPLAGTAATGLARVIGSFSSATFSLLDHEGNVIGPANLAAGSEDAAADQFVGSVTPPDVPFRVSVAGTDGTGAPFQRLFPALFTAQSLQVTLDPSSAPDSLPVGASTTLHFVVQNLGSASTFSILAVDNLRFVSAVEPAQLDLASGATGTFDVTLTVPSETTAGLDVQLTVTVTDIHAPARTNSASLALLTGTSNASPNCGHPMPIDLWPPNCVFRTKVNTCFGRT